MKGIKKKGKDIQGNERKRTNLNAKFKGHENKWKQFKIT